MNFIAELKHRNVIRVAGLPFSGWLGPASGNVLDGQMVADALMMLGEHALALDYMEPIAGNLGNNMEWAVMLPQMEPIRCEPRFFERVSKLKTHDPRRAAVCKGTP